MRRTTLVAALAASFLILLGLDVVTADEQGPEKIPEPALRFAKEASLRISEIERDWQKLADRVAKARGDFVLPIRRHTDVSLREEAAKLLASAKTLLDAEKRIGPETERFRDALKKAASQYREVAALYKAHAEKAKAKEVREDYLQLVKLYQAKADAATDRAQKLTVPPALKAAREVIEEGNGFIERLLEALSVGPVSEVDCEVLALRLTNHGERCLSLSSELSVAIEKILGSPVATGQRATCSEKASYVRGGAKELQGAAEKGSVEPKAILGVSWTSTLTIRGVECRQIVCFKENGSCTQSIYRMGSKGLGPLLGTGTYTFKLHPGGRLSVYAAGQFIESGKITVLSEDRWVYEIAENVGDPARSGSRINFVRNDKR